MGEKGDELLEHDSKDLLCPCPELACAGNLARRSGSLRIIEIVFKLCAVGFAGFLAFWTALASPGIADRTWTTAWSAPFAATAILSSILYILSPVFVRFSTNTPLLDLSQRVGHHAMRLALSPMLEHYWKQIDDGSTADKDNAAPGDFIELHLLLSSVWRRRILQYNASPALLVPLSVTVILGLLNVFSFACIPAVYLAYIFYLLSLNFIDLVNVAAANSQIVEIRSLYLDATRELHQLHRKALNGPHGANRRLIAAMESDAELLGSYLDVDRYRARFMGFVVTASVV